MDTSTTLAKGQQYKVTTSTASNRHKSYTDTAEGNQGEAQQDKRTSLWQQNKNNKSGGSALQWVSAAKQGLESGS